MRTCITTSETAAKLGKTVNWLYRHRGELVAKFGFPRPLAATGCYDELAVDLWFVRFGTVGQTRTNRRGRPHP